MIGVINTNKREVIKLTDRTYLQITDFADMLPPERKSRKIDITFIGRDNVKIVFEVEPRKTMTYYIVKRIRWGLPKSGRWKPEYYPSVVVRELPSGQYKIVFFGRIPGAPQSWSVQRLMVPADETLVQKMKTAGLAVVCLPLVNAAQ